MHPLTPLHSTGRLACLLTLVVLTALVLNRAPSAAALTNRLTPVDVSGSGSWVVALAAGGDHTCALSTSGGVKCWGENGNGQLGDGTTTSRLTPVHVHGLRDGVVALAAGLYHTCALSTSGGAKCWGWNDSGQLGDGTITSRLTPVDVSGLGSGVAALAAGWEHTCALLEGGRVKCWGYDTGGLRPVEVTGLGSDAIALAAGWGHTCAVLTSGGVKCWGSNVYGQLGDGTTSDRLKPVDVSELGSGVVALAAGIGHTCALLEGGGVKCWGYNSGGQLGDGTTSDRLTPVDVSGLGSGVAALTLGWTHTCALLTSGGAKCWGYNGSGRLGDGTTTQRLTPVDVSGLRSEVTAVAAGGEHTCALMTSGRVKCWGGNYAGQLGDGTTTDRLIPVYVVGLNSLFIPIAVR